MLKIYLKKNQKRLLNLKKFNMIKNKLKKNAKIVDKYLLNFLKKQKNQLLVSPMKYGVISGGKKIRSTIIFDTGKLFKY